MALPPPIARQQQQQHARNLSRLNMNIPGVAAPFGEPQLFTPQGQPQYPQFPHSAQPGGPQTAFNFAPNHMQQQQQRQLGHGHTPSMSMHRSRPSLAAIPGFLPGGPMTAGPNIPTFNPFPIPPTPGGTQQQFPNQLQPPHFRSRRQQSISIGGPPKALLGGPQRKVSPSPNAVASAPTPDIKQRKINVKLPKESSADADTIDNGDASAASSSYSWRRTPIPSDALPPLPDIVPPEITSVTENRDSESSEGVNPAEVTVTLPRRNAWEAYRATIMEEKLAKLGVEPAGFVGPPIGHVPNHIMLHHHNRASSISTPADPALLARHGLANPQAPGPLAAAAPMSGAGPSAASAPFQSSHRPNPLAPPFVFQGSTTTPSQGPHIQALGPAPRGFHHGHSLSLATPIFGQQTNPYLSPAFGRGSTNPFGSAATMGGDSGGPSQSVSPMPGTSLASVSEYDEVEEDDGSSGNGPKIHAPKPRGMLHLRPVFVSHQSSPARSPAPSSIREEDENITPPVTAVAPAKTLSSVDFMRGFGIESDEEEEGEGEEGREVAQVERSDVQEDAPIVDEVQRDRLISEEVTQPTPTASRFPTDAVSEGDAIEDNIDVVDLAEDADEEDASDPNLGEDVDEAGTEADDDGLARDDGDNFTTPSHSRHVSKVSMAPSLAEVGVNVLGGSSAPGSGRSFRDFRFGGVRPSGSELREVDGEETENVAGSTSGRVVYLNDDGDLQRESEWDEPNDYRENDAPQRLVSDTDEDMGEWSNPSDEERAREERRALRDQARRAVRYEEEQDHTLHSQHSFISNPSNEGGRQSADIVSNPSDDEAFGGGGMTFGGNILAQAQRARVAENPFYMGSNQPTEFSPTVQRPLPPLPHSRDQSLNGLSPANVSSPLVKGHNPAPSLTKTDLNPLARPFVFGARPGSNSFNLQSPSTEPGSVPATAHGRGPSQHSRQISVSKLNIAAPEFKPSGVFTFTPINALPTMPYPITALTALTSQLRPLPQPPKDEPPFLTQGREKRQRISDDENPTLDGDAQEVGTSPTLQNPAEQTKEQVKSSEPVLNVNAKPFTFTGNAFSSLKPDAPAFEPSRPLSFSSGPQAKSEQQSPVRVASPQPDKAVSMPASAVGSPPATEPASLSPIRNPTAAFGRPLPRMPIPDFSHPVSNNTVPASVFKALHMEGDGPTRPSVRSRLGSRDFMEHAARRSLDDINVPSISKKLAPKPAATLPPPEPVHFVPKQSVPLLALAPPPRGKERRSSAPSQPLEVREQSLREPSPAISAVSDAVASSNTSRREDLDHLETRIEEIIEDKIGQIRDDISSLADVKSQTSDTAVNAAIGQLVSTFRAQMMDYMKKIAETSASRADAHVELDFDLIKSSIEEGHQALRSTLQKELAALGERVHAQPPARLLPPMEVLHAIEDLRSAVTDSMNAATQTMLSHADDNNSFHQRRLQEERQTLIRDLSALLLPRITALRPDPIDMDTMTRQLSEAVKPHISQLIDLASDKKETAILITQQLSPILHSLAPPRLDLTAIASQLAMDVVRLAPPTDPHVLKEEVADLVIERLDARLANRDATFNPELIASRVAKIVGPLSDLAKIPSPESVEALNARQDNLFSQSAELLAQQANALGKLDVIPDSVRSAVEAIKAAQEDLSAKSKLLGDMEELKTLSATNAELQTQLGKARGAHGQVRSEKDVLSQRLQAVEQERDRLRAEVEALKAATTSRDSELLALKADKVSANIQLDAVTKRVDMAEECATTEREKATAAENRRQVTAEELHNAKTKVEVLEATALHQARERETLAKAKEALETEVASLRAQQRHWDDLRRTADQVQNLARLIGQADNEEMADLKRIRERHHALDKEHTSLQKRCADQEAKIAKLQREGASSKQILLQAQQKADQWEKQAHALEDELESLQTQLEEARDVQGQYEGDVAALKEEIQTNVTAMKLAGEREQQLQNKVATLESQLLSAQEELKEAQMTGPAPVLAPRPQLNTSNSWQKAIAVPNGRPGSPGSDISRPGTVTPNGRESPSSPDTPPARQQGLWASMHAPKNGVAPSYSTPPATIHKPRKYTSQRTYPVPAMPSPTNSVISLAATEREDGWWS